MHTIVYVPQTVFHWHIQTPSVVNSRMLQTYIHIEYQQYHPMDLLSFVESNEQLSLLVLRNDLSTNISLDKNIYASFEIAALVE